MIKMIQRCHADCFGEAALDFLKVPYESVEVDPLTRSQIKFSKEPMEMEPWPS